MNRENVENKNIDEYKFWFASLQGISSRKKIQLISEASEREIYEMSSLELLQLCTFYEVDGNIILSARENDKTRDKLLENYQRQRIRQVTFSDSDYPRKLKNINQPPYALYYKGTLVPDRVSVAIVGARRCSEYGRSVAQKLGVELAKCGVPVLSGMACGIDCAGHAGAMEAGGSTYGVLGCGVDVCYPVEARNIYENIVKSGGGILSEYLPGTNPLPKFFPARNRIISGLADIVVVIEAKLHSGSLITADFALEQGKDVYALPGRILDKNSQGTNHLIYQGAAILDDIPQFLLDNNLKRLDGCISDNQKKFTLEKEESLLYSVLDFEPKHLDTIIEETGFSGAVIFGCLDSLKKKRLIRESYKNYFCRNL